jgi:Erythronolide synthase docking domain
MNSTQEELIKALRKSLKENERLKREIREYLALTTEPVAVVGMVRPGRRDQRFAAIGQHQQQLHHPVPPHPAAIPAWR